MIQNIHEISFRKIFMHKIMPHCIKTSLLRITLKQFSLQCNKGIEIIISIIYHCI